MSLYEIENVLLLDEGSAKLKEQYNRYCDWCWGNGFGDCRKCKKLFFKYYIPIRKAEIKAKLGLKEQSND